MPLFTRREFRDMTGQSRQSIHQKIKKGTLRTVRKETPLMVEYIELSEEELGNMKKKKQG